MEEKSSSKKGMGTGAKIAIGCIVLIVISIVCFVIISALGIAGVSQVAEEITQEVEKREEEANSKFESPKAINTEVVVGDVSWKILSAENLGSSLKAEYGDDCVANSGTFISVKFQVTNNSDEMVSISELNIFDSQEREYITSSDVYSCVEDDLFILENLNPGLTKTFTAVYEVPDTAKELRVKVTDLQFFSDNYEYVSLGL